MKIPNYVTKGLVDRTIKSVYGSAKDFKANANSYPHRAYYNFTNDTVSYIILPYKDNASISQFEKSKIGFIPLKNNEEISNIISKYKKGQLTYQGLTVSIAQSINRYAYEQSKK